RSGEVPGTDRGSLLPPGGPTPPLVHPHGCRGPPKGGGVGARDAKGVEGNGKPEPRSRHGGVRRLSLHRRGRRGVARALGKEQGEPSGTAVFIPAHSRLSDPGGPFAKTGALS